MSPNINPIQAMIAAASAQWTEERARTQMTLGKLIARLAKLKKTTLVDLHSPHSYRGYYSDLAFEAVGNPRPVKDVLKEAKGCLGKVFEGYKGGDFPMHENTPVWIASYGRTGTRIMSVEEDGTITTKDEEGI